MKKLLAYVIVTSIATSLWSAPAKVRATWPVQQDRAVDRLPIVEIAAPDREALRSEDLAASRDGQPYRFAVPHEVWYGPYNSGVWEKTAQGDYLWRLRIHGAGAQTLNLGFTRFHLPKGARLTVAAADLSHAVGPYDFRQNKTGQLWTPVVYSDDVVVELVVPDDLLAEVELVLERINYGYRGFDSSGENSGEKSGACNVDTICSEGNPYRDQIQSVARIIIQGAFVCSGSLINNTALDQRPLFLTADHCVGPGDASSLVFYWNYENSTCRTPGSGQSGGSGNGSLGDSQSGATYLAGHSISDFTLVELDQAPESAWNVFFSGWDKRDNAPTKAVAIHHPQGDEKRISFENDPLTSQTYLSESANDGTHWMVDDWDIGTTEGGSSGSPLYNAQKRIVGQLHGGFAACGNDDPDWYGKLSRSWTSGLKAFLDPGSTGASTLNGLDPNEEPPPQVPNTPTNLQATPLSANSIQLLWVDQSGDEDLFSIEMKAPGGSFEEIGQVAANVTSALVDSLVADTYYVFRVRAQNSVGWSAYSNNKGATTLASEQGPPAAPTDLGGESLSTTSVRLTWMDESTNEDSFVIRQRHVATLSALNGGVGSTLVDGPWQEVAVVNSGVETVNLDSLNSASTYEFEVLARNSSGDSPATTTLSLTTHGLDSAGSCLTGASALCLQNRFRVEAFWKNQYQGGVMGGGTAVERTEKSGLFWFFNSENIELVVKILDATELTGTFWTFYGALSDVEYWIVIADTQEGTILTLHNPPGELCGQKEFNTLVSETSPPLAGFPLGESPLEFAKGTGTGTCIADDTTLCLHENRFALQVHWINQHGGGVEGEGHPLTFSSSEKTGFFWFFNEANLELVVKILDGTTVNGSFWVFYGALSDVEYRLTVTDTVTSDSKIYHNPPGEFCGLADTGAF